LPGHHFCFAFICALEFIFDQSKDLKMPFNRHKLFKFAKGYKDSSSNVYTPARRRVEKALQYMYRDRREKKRNFRELWIQRINAGTRQFGVKYLTVII
jgi:ribosomal protein L20